MTSAEWRETLEGLAERVAQSGKEIASLEKDQRRLVLPAKRGDAKAEADLLRVQGELIKARQEFADLGLAAEEARRELAMATATEEAARIAERRVEAARLAALRVEQAREVDLSLRRLSQAVGAFMATGRTLGTYHDVTGREERDMNQPFRVGAAFAAADSALFRALDGRPVSVESLGRQEESLWEAFLSRWG